MNDEIKGTKMRLICVVRIRLNRGVLPTGRKGRNSRQERYTSHIELRVNGLTN